MAKRSCRSLHSLHKRHCGLEGTIAFALGPRNRVRVAFVVPLVAVGSLAAVLAQELSFVTTAGRINVRRLEDGRLEFALQQREGDTWEGRMLRPQRFVPRNVGHTGWLTSAPFLIEVSAPETAPSELDLIGVGDTPPVISAVARTTTERDPLPVNVEPPKLARFDLGPVPPSALTVTAVNEQWTTWSIPLAGLPTCYATSFSGSAVLYSQAGGSRSGWEQTTGAGPMAIAVNLRHAPDQLLRDVARELRSTCGVAVPEVVVAPEQCGQWPTAEPPDWQPFQISPGAVTGTWDMAEEEGGWSVWQMYRAGRNRRLRCLAGRHWLAPRQDTRAGMADNDRSGTPRPLRLCPPVLHRHRDGRHRTSLRRGRAGAGGGERATAGCRQPRGGVAETPRGARVGDAERELRI